MDTLRFTVSRLLLDFEDKPQELGNVVEEFNVKGREGKHEALIRLNGMLAGVNEKVAEKKASKSTNLKT